MQEGEELGRENRGDWDQVPACHADVPQSLLQASLAAAQGVREYAPGW